MHGYRRPTPSHRRNRIASAKKTGAAPQGAAKQDQIDASCNAHEPETRLRTGKKPRAQRATVGVGYSLLKEKCAERVQCVVRYKPNRDGNRCGKKRDASNLNNDRRVTLIAPYDVHEILVLTSSCLDGT